MSGFVAGQSLPAADLNAALVLKRVRVATTAAGTLASDYENGDTVDGVVLATGDRILLKNQAAGAANGIYVVAASGAPTRAVDFDSSAEVLPNTMVVVSEGTTNADTVWQLTTNATITLDTTALVFAQFGASSGASGPALIRTFVDPTSPSGASVAITTASNRAFHCRVVQGGTVTKLAIHVGTSSGNISLAVTRGTAGRAGPTSRVVTTGAIACPASGYAEAAVVSTVVDGTTDWFAVSADNTTATVYGKVCGAIDSAFALGYMGLENSSHPIVASPSITASMVGFMPAIIGVP